MYASPPPLGDLRCGDYVKVRDDLRATNLGQGRVIDIRTTSTGIPVEALVRFDSGSVKGYWYAVGSLTRLADFRGNPV